jgi:hypothetical protein
MRKAVLAVLALAAFVVSTGTAEAQQAGNQVTLSAQVIDFACKVAGDMSGPEHRMCTQACADQGVPLALLGSDGHIYVPIGEGMPSGSQNSRLRDYAEQQVTVVGRVIERGGVRGIMIQEIRRS